MSGSMRNASTEAPSSDLAKLSTLSTDDVIEKRNAALCFPMRPNVTSTCTPAELTDHLIRLTDPREISQKKYLLWEFILLMAVNENFHSSHVESFIQKDSILGWSLYKQVEKFYPEKLKFLDFVIAQSKREPLDQLIILLIHPVS